MEFETIVFLAKQRETTFAKKIIAEMSERFDTMIVTPFRMGQLGDDALISFKVSHSHYKMLTEVLIKNNIRVLANDAKTQQIVSNMADNGQMAKKNAPLVSQGWEDIKTTRTENVRSRLDNQIRAGNYEEVIRISKDIKLDSQTINEAKLSVNNAIIRAIEISISEARHRRYEVQKFLERLLKIASDNQLKLMNKTDMMKMAGIAAINICTEYTDYINDLIKMANNNAMHNLVSVKAASAFSSVVFQEEGKFKEDIDYAVRFLNLKWLDISMDVVYNELTPTELNNIKKLKDYVIAKRGS